MIERPLRFCHITTFYPPYSFGGDAVYVQHLAHALAARGHHVEVIHCLDSYRLLAQGQTLRASYDHPNVVVHRLQSKWGALSPLATQQTGYPFLKTKEIEKIFARGFDVIHYHNLSLVGGPKLLEMGSALKLYTTHEYWLVCPMHVLFRYDGVACQEKKCLRCTLAHGRPPQWWRYTDMLKNAVQHIDMLLHPSEFTMTRHAELQRPGTVLRYFNPQELVTVDKAPPSNTKPYFLFVGRFEVSKGAHTLIPFFRAFDRARLILVGGGNEKARLQELAGDSSNIEFTGWLDAKQLSQLYRNAVAVIVPSLVYESGPLVVVESFIQHTPVIARELGALPDIVNETGGGVLYRDDTSLRAAVEELLDFPARRDELGERGYRASQTIYTTDAHLARYFEIIETIMAEKMPRPLDL